MPEVTTVMNIEFETKRKFYYYSDEMIDGLSYIEREEIPEVLKRLYKITDNRLVFLNYLTSKTVCFKRDNGEYVSWWKRLCNTKLDGLKSDTKLLREYSNIIDERASKVRFISSVATTAVYNDNIKSDFIHDISDLLSNLNDNTKHNFSIHDNSGEILRELDSEYLRYYIDLKIRKNKHLKNRKKDAKFGAIVKFVSILKGYNEMRKKEINKPKR